MTSFVFIKIHLNILFKVSCDSYICLEGSLWSCCMFLSCFHVHAFSGPKAILTRVCLLNNIFKEPEIPKRPIPKEKTPVPPPEKLERPPAKGA